MRRSATVFGLLLGLLCVLVTAHSVRAAESIDPNWLTTKDFTLTKTAELAQNTTPSSFGVDCVDTIYRLGPKNIGQERQGCAVQTPIGLMHNGYIIAGPNGTLSLNTKNHAGVMAGTVPGSTQVLMLKSAGVFTGTYIEVSEYDPSLFVYRMYSGYPPTLTYEYVPVAGSLLTSSNGVALRLSHSSLAYSQNGNWLTVLDVENGIWRFDTETWRGKLIGWLLGASTSNSQTGGTNLAISDDGQYIAVNDTVTQVGIKKPSLKVFDTTTCENLSPYYQAASREAAEPCEHNDIWNGISRGVGYEGGVIKELTEAEGPRQIRFSGDDAITFSTVYDRVSATEYKAASYRLSIMQQESPTLELLALGDSYISGEGAFQYREGTDTSSNKCHNSFNAYPQLLGARLTASYNSVACSGAVTEDVYNSQRNYKNQLIPKLTQGDYSERERSDIIASFSPGNINQLKFIDGYKPNKALLSIGGNDIHFADIISLCVLSANDDACFDSAIERKALLRLIYDQHEVLTKTYEDILVANPTTSLYVIGYPQIAKVGGDCGVNVRLDASELEFGSLLISRLNATIRNAAESVGVRYVDVEQALYGSRLCENSVDAVNGLTSGGDTALGLLGQESFHPTAYGHILLANTISRQTSELTQVMPVATNSGKLNLDQDDIFITGAKPSGKSVKKLIFGVFTKKTNTAYKVERFNFDTKTLGISSGTAFNIAYHSKEVEVARGVVPADGIIDIDITVPDITPGAHTLHLFTKDSTGTELDIMQVVYIAASEIDYDGDGISNYVDSCSLVKNSGIDTDGDGIDDVCDGDSAVLVSAFTQKDTETSQNPRANEVSANTVEQNDITYSEASSTTPQVQSGVVLASRQTTPVDTGDIAEGTAERAASTEESSISTRTIMIGAIIAVVVIFGLVYTHILVRN